MNPLLKILISAVLVGIISEIARRNTTAGALIASIPLVSVLAMIWLYQDTKDIAAVSAFSTSVFWYVLPSLILFVLLPVCLTVWHLPFYLALSISTAATVAGFFLLKFFAVIFGVRL